MDSIVDLNNFSDGIILIVCGALVALFGAGILFPKMAKEDAIGKGKMRVVAVIGLIIILGGVVQLVRHLV